MAVKAGGTGLQCADRLSLSDSSVYPHDLDRPAVIVNGMSVASRRPPRPSARGGGTSCSTRGRAHVGSTGDRKGGRRQGALYSSFGSKGAGRAYLQGRHERRRSRLLAGWSGTGTRATGCSVSSTSGRDGIRAGLPRRAFYNDSAESPTGGPVEEVSDTNRAGPAGCSTNSPATPRSRPGGTAENFVLLYDGAMVGTRWTGAAAPRPPRRPWRRPVGRRDQAALTSSRGGSVVVGDQVAEPSRPGSRQDRRVVVGRAAEHSARAAPDSRRRATAARPAW